MECQWARELGLLGPYRVQAASDTQLGGDGLPCPEEKMPEPQPGPADPFRAFS